MAEINQEEWDRTYCYPGTHVLINKLEIKDMDTLQKFETSITSAELARLKKQPIKGNLDMNHLKKIHGEIFGKIYNWAGKTRTVNMAKGEVFCFCEYIPQMGDDIFGKLQKENYLIGESKDIVCKRLAYYMGEINAMHPFREGNGRTQREFINTLANVAGYQVNFATISQAEMIKASRESIKCEYASMEALFTKIIRKLPEDRHRLLVTKLCTERGAVRGRADAYFKSLDNIKKELQHAGIKPTSKLVLNMKKINDVFHKEHTVKEIRGYATQLNTFSKEQQVLIKSIEVDARKQERSLER